MNKVEVINAQVKKLKVCGYARVSTDEEKQDSSYMLQINELIDMIKSNDQYEFINVFFDKGTGTNQNRKGFLSMIELAKAKYIDLILVKSITRFGRNTSETISTVKELKGYGVGVYFLKENIHSLDSTNDFIFNILSSHADEESKNISDNTRWSMTKRMEQGADYTPRMYGFNISKGEFTINEKEAEAVRLIFGLYLNGTSYQEMINILHKKGIPSPYGKEYWSHHTIQGILVNEKHCGNSMIRKTVTTLNKTRRVSRDDIQYFVRNSHEGIISYETWCKAQELRQTNRIHNALPFSQREITNSDKYVGFVYSNIANMNMRFVRDKHVEHKFQIDYLITPTRYNCKRTSLQVKHLFTLLASSAKELCANYKLVENIGFDNKLESLSNRINELQQQNELDLASLELIQNNMISHLTESNNKAFASKLYSKLYSLSVVSTIVDFRNIFHKVIVNQNNNYDIFLFETSSNLVLSFECIYLKRLSETRNQTIKNHVNIFL
jgi:DNA invertase Pin-like site-specific DNA recombinase